MSRCYFCLILINHSQSHEAPSSHRRTSDLLAALRFLTSSQLYLTLAQPSQGTMATLTALTVSIGNSVHELHCHRDQEVFLNFMPKEKTHCSGASMPRYPRSLPVRWAFCIWTIHISRAYFVRRGYSTIGRSDGVLLFNAIQRPVFDRRPQLKA